MVLLMLLLVATFGPTGCGAEGSLPTADGATIEEGGQGRDGASPDQGSADGEAGPRAGPSTLVTAEAELIDARLCDLDGDGVLDNGIADLGPVEGSLFLIGLNSMLVQADEGHNRICFHFPWLDDLSGPDDEEALLISGECLDTDVPRDPSDDLDGDEPFWFVWRGLDRCGEPLDYFRGCSVAAGQLETPSAGTFVFWITGELPLHVDPARLTGTLDPSAGRGSLDLCGAVTIHESGGLAAAELAVGDLSFLEVLLAGGAALGAPSLPGLSPDLDLDGDGLERFETDESGRILACIDGDLTAIEGRDCWMDERMADGLSLNARFELASARLEGLQPGWQTRVEGSCDDPPEASLWEPEPRE